MGDLSNEYLILLGVIIVQAIIAMLTVFEGFQIRNVFSRDLDNYILESYSPSTDSGKSIDRPIIKALRSNDGLDLILDRINKYLISNYEKNKSPDVTPLESLIKNQSRVNDSRASLFASFPILIGLAGTIIGLLYAFTEIDKQNITETSGVDNGGSVNFLSLISKSSSIVFWGSLIGIVLSIFLNYLISTFKLHRDIRANQLIFFLNYKLAPALPSVREETVSLIANQLEIFSDSYFERFRAYASEFDKLTVSIQNLYEVGFKSIIERNTQIMEKLIQTIDTLDDLNKTSKAIRFKPEMYQEFIFSSQELVSSNLTYVQKLDEYGGYFMQLNQSFRELQDRVNRGVIDLSTDRNLIGDFKTAMDNFRTSTVERTVQMAKSASEFDNILEEYKQLYQNSMNEIRDRILTKIEKSINPEDYKTLIEKLVAVSSSLEKESSNIQQLGSSMTQLNEKLSKELTPSLNSVSKIIDKLNVTVDKLDVTVEQTIPQALSETVKANKQMVLETSKELLKEPRSWGQWSFLGFRKLFRKNKISSNGSGK